MLYLLMLWTMAGSCFRQAVPYLLLLQALPLLLQELLEAALCAGQLQHSFLQAAAGLVLLRRVHILRRAQLGSYTGLSSQM